MLNKDIKPFPVPEDPPAPIVRPEALPYGSEPSGRLPEFPVVWPSAQELVSALDDGVYVASADGRILLVNEGLVNLLRAENADALMGLRVQSLPIDAHLQRVPVPTGPVWIRGFHGGDILVQHVAVDWDSGPGGCSAGLFRRAGGDRLAALGMGVTGILHDLRNVLTGIMGNADELANAADPDGQAHAVGRLQDLAAFGNAIAEQLVTFAGPSAGPKRACHLNQAIEETVLSFKGRVPDTVQIDFEFVNGLTPVWVDATQVRQLVMNLLLNASNALRGQVGTVTFRTAEEEASPRLPLHGRIERRPRGRYGVVEVRDTGEGISEDAMRRIFNPFVTTTGGSGLGLSVVREILLRCGGGIEIDSQVGRGSAFRLYLPIRE